MQENTTTEPEFDNVQVTAIPYVDENGKTKYRTTFNPETVTVTTHDAILNYQLVAPTPDGVKFSKVSIKPEHSDQFSEPSISVSGKMVTFSDANTVKESLALTFHFTDSDGVEFLVDPEVDNNPPITKEI
ncbi:hypothetical protein GJ700_23840 [Duganella sp. FT92W]|uniref:DP-EP family protein n=1 Tax=Pseudoduganella rivuli TaxID=2666085 RepID=A0A7X2IRP0_9BURK|nr:hypothetical protein [Pseudoduganella rivuli]MRV74749.1 hypothetical protein [Pseudoduganella rivuli]